MSEVINRLSSGSRLLFWGIVPLGGLMLGLMTFMTHDWTLKRTLVLGAIDLTFLLLALALYNPKRFSWALGIVLMLVFLWYCFYVVDQVLLLGTSCALAKLAVRGQPDQRAERPAPYRPPCFGRFYWNTDEA